MMSADNKRLVELLLDNVEMRPVPDAGPNDEGLPYATHSGVLRIGAIKLDVVALNTGQRVITEESLAAVLNAVEGHA